MVFDDFNMFLSVTIFKCMNIVIKIILYNTLLLVEISLSNNKKHVPKILLNVPLILLLILYKKYNNQYNKNMK